MKLTDQDIDFSYEDIYKELKKLNIDLELNEDFKYLEPELQNKTNIKKLTAITNAVLENEDVSNEYAYGHRVKYPLYSKKLSLKLKNVSQQNTDVGIGTMRYGMISNRRISNKNEGRVIYT